MYNKNHQVQIIAEIGTTHGGSISKAKDLIQACAESGADFVKFQWVYADEILHPNTGFVSLPGGNIRLYDRFKQLELTIDFYAEVKDYAKSCGCGFICSPFGLRSLKELISINPDAIKIASPELNHFPLLAELTRTKKNIPVILSSGVSTLADIEKALSFFDNKDSVSLLHCITSYPAPLEEYNVKLIENLRNIFGINTGLSDHSMHPYLVPVLSTVFGATQIEKHITLSRQTDGLDDPVALEPDDFSLMVQEVRQTEKIINEYGSEQGLLKITKKLNKEFSENTISKVIGDGIKKLANSEKLNYGRTNRSIHFMNNMKKGEIISKESISVLRTEKILTPGISPEYLEEIIGLTLTKDVCAGQGVEWQHITTTSSNT